MRARDATDTGAMSFNACETCLERQTAHPDWPQVKSILVEPGGYDSKPEDLLKFYEACGFRLSADKSHLTLVLDERESK